ncbi:hypothetical protein [Celerinatantimonas sp. YJH-8]|uniref:hypothetical protein n=1 Tax=Celerinatantimonas sp. YJH-8 TaxID=3228714 RepID=UPI0038BEAC49
MKYVLDRARPYESRCQTFRMSPAEAVIFFQTAQVISNPAQFRQLAKPAACYYQGIIQTHGNMLQWRITAAGVGYLTYGPGNPNNRQLLCGTACHQQFGERLDVYPIDSK